MGYRLLLYLVEVEYGCQARVHPNRVSCALSKLLAGRGRKERRGDSKCFGDRIFFRVGKFANEFQTCNNVTPLVGTAYLYRATKMLVKMIEIICLEKLVSKLCE